MALLSRKGSSLRIRSKEAVAGTEDTHDFFDSESCVMTKPMAKYLWESNHGKLGQGQFGDTADILGVYTPFSIKCTKLSEVAFFMSYALGTADNVYTVPALTTTYNHYIKNLAVASRTLPTFSMQYLDGLETVAMTHCVINDFTLVLKEGGNGMVEFTANGFGNLHNVVAGTITRNTAASWTLGTYNTQLQTEPLINFAGLKLWAGTALTTVPLVQSVMSMTGEDLAGTPEELTPFLNSITVNYNNGLSGEVLLRAGGGGVLNNQQRMDPSMSLDLSFRKDTALPSGGFDAMVLAKTQKAIELQWIGKLITSGGYHAMNLFFPVVQFQDPAEDDGGPISQNIKAYVFQDSTELALGAYFQSAIVGAYNGTLS